MGSPQRMGGPGGMPQANQKNNLHLIILSIISILLAAILVLLIVYATRRDDGANALPSRSESSATESTPAENQLEESSRPSEESRYKDAVKEMDIDVWITSGDTLEKALDKRTVVFNKFTGFFDDVLEENHIDPNGMLRGLRAEGNTLIYENIFYNNDYNDIYSLMPKIMCEPMSSISHELEDDYGFENVKIRYLLERETSGKPRILLDKTYSADSVCTVRRGFSA